LRLSPQQLWEPKFRNQHRYVWLLYGFNTLEWIFVKDLVQYFNRRVNPYRPVPEMSFSEKLEFWLCKAIYCVLFVALPFFLHPAWLVVLGFLLFHLVLGLALTIVFQLAHLNEKAEFPVPTGDPATIDEEWAIHQMKTTANFPTDNCLVNWFTGGLNHQIEHHLVPNICHIHYPDISVTVRRTAAEFGLPYHVHEYFWGAVGSHYRMLRDLASPPVNHVPG
jgi:linoleoyl-CoA desaturase